ncbi:hypothetical protein D3C77_612630 [compost metagenome]
MAQQRLARTRAAGLGRDVQVFEVDALGAEPGRITEEVHRKADGLAVTLADQRLGAAAFAEQRALDIGDRGDHLVAGTLVLGKLGDEGEDLAGVFDARGADMYGHGGASVPEIEEGYPKAITGRGHGKPGGW